MLSGGTLSNLYLYMYAENTRNVNVNQVGSQKRRREHK